MFDTQNLSFFLFKFKCFNFKFSAQQPPFGCAPASEAYQQQIPKPPAKASKAISVPKP
jgi:hypothetical protein